MRNYVLALAFVFLAVTPSFAAEGDGLADMEDGTIAAEGTVGEHPKGDVAAADIFWDFITCVHTEHDCLHEAQHHGYPHWKTVHDHHTCPHSPNTACYGGHH